MLEAQWVRDNRHFDLIHLQFGFDARSPQQLQEWIVALRETGRPLLYTVHDLRNPHHVDRTLHDEQLDVLIPNADALITLTNGAAAEIEARWGREALVLPHPHVVDFETMQTLRRQPRKPDTFRVGVHVKSLRANMNPLPVLQALRDAISQIPSATLQVNGHRDVLLESGERYQADLADFLHDGHARGDLDLRVHDFLSDSQLWDYLASLDASVLPYRFGTHSGWLEACRDLGTTVIAPNCGYYREQGSVFEYELTADGVDAASVAVAVKRAYEHGAAQPETVASRRVQRQQIVAAHQHLYERLLQ